MNATTPAPARQRKPLRPVHGTCRWLRKPVWPCELIPEGQPGVLLINGTAYGVMPVAELPATGEPVTRGFRLTKPDGTVYDVGLNWTHAGLSCDCPDALSRPARPGGCKHAAAL